MNFTHDYRKLDRKIFPTVRSVNYMKQHSLTIGCNDGINVKKSYKGKAKLIAVEHKPINAMDLAFLRYDSACSLPNIATKQEYVDLLNSFIPFNSNQLTTVKSILWMMWV